MLMPFLILYVVLLSGSTLCCTLFPCRFEDILPLTCITIVLILFPFGLFGWLSGGVYFILILSAAAYLFSFFSLYKKHGPKDFAKRLFTPAFFLFALLSLALAIVNYGRMLLAWDDFSHWGDVVKVMTTMDVMSTAPCSNSLFKEYPPGMALFQYFLQKLILLFVPGGCFTEYPLFFSYQLFFFALLFPFFKKLNFKNILSYIVLLLLFLCPLAFFKDMYSQLKIDPFLAAVFACALAFIFSCRKPRPLHYTSVFLYLSLLVLSKSSGLMLAVMASLAFILAQFSCSTLSGRRKLLYSGGCILSVFLPYVLWEFSIRLNHAEKAFDLMNDVASAASGSYRMEAFKRYIMAFLSEGVTEPGAAVSVIPSILLFVLIMVLLYFVCRKYARLFPNRQPLYTRLFLVTLFSFIVYFGGLCIAYLFSFSPEEALTLAGFARYINTIFFAGALLLLLLTIDLISLRALDATKIVLILLCVETAITPWLSALYFVSRSNVQYSIEKRQAYDDVISRLDSISSNEPYSAYVISADPYDNVVLRYSLRPNSINPPDTWYGLGTPGADNKGNLSAEAWQSQLIESFDYVVLYSVNESFASEYGSLFEDPNSIQNSGIYSIDKSSGLLTKCGG